MAENRRKAAAPRKAYSYPDLAALAHASEAGEQEGVRRAAEARTAAASSPGHDHLGTPALLQLLAGKPHLLPLHLQATASCPDLHSGSG